ncbi:GNAT family N-acetyltransferase [Tunturibacter empetritectus]|uniref:GNAT family N-acetyltransferase n=1 Tax=Tunturiibacter empetritectus TaxID=3069691 RepID=A0AAU7ZHW2_9BACT
MAVQIQSTRLQLSTFEMADAEEVFACITPAVARFMSWEPPKSFTEYKARREARLQAADPTEFAFVIRRRDTKECLGITALERADLPSPELGIWMKEAAHGQGYGGEAVRAVAEWAAKDLGKDTFLYPVAVENTASRHIAEKLHGEIIGTRRSPKYESVVYQIRAFARL